jgi:hypothetical protein
MGSSIKSLGYLRDTYEDSNVSILKEDSDPKNSGAFDGTDGSIYKIKKPR